MTARPFCITREIQFDSAHRLQHHNGKCKNLHGHRYRLLVTLEAGSVPTSGMVFDFGLLKDQVKGWIDANWDHRTLLDVGDPLVDVLTRHGFAESVVCLDRAPTAENLAFKLAEVIETQFSGTWGPNIKLSKVELWETPNCCATWTATGVPPWRTVGDVS